jgi:hypothetical protein
MLKLISLSNIIVWSTTIFFSSNIFAEYYFVYPELPSCNQSCSVKKIYKKHYKYAKAKKHVRRYVARKSPIVENYYIIKTCDGSINIPKCGGMASYIPSGCGGQCAANFYVPPEYYQSNIYPDYKYYDPDPDWDMRTRDDFYY